MRKMLLVFAMSLPLPSYAAFATQLADASKFMNDSEPEMCLDKNEERRI